MRSPLTEIERAKADGRWEAAYDGMATAEVPDDLASALEVAGLTELFAGLASRTRYPRAGSRANAARDQR